MFSFFQKPFPHSDLDHTSVIKNFMIGSFVALFLIVFQPFQINEWHTENKILKLMGFGFVSFIVPLLMNVIIARVIYKKPIEDNWTIGKEIMAIIIVLLCIAFGNLFYGFLLNIVPFTFKGFLFALIAVLLIGVFPVGLHVIRKHNKLLKINLLQAGTVNEHLHPIEIKNNREEKITSPEEIPLPNEPDSIVDPDPLKLIFTAENEKDKLELTTEQLLYIESADNYSNLVFLENGKIKKQLMRSSLKRMESQIKFDYIVRCHRTFIVNLKNVSHVDGNAAGYKLSFAGIENTVPVSRNYGSGVIERLKKLN